MAAAAGGATRALSQQELTWKEQDIQMMLAADVNLGIKTNCDFEMERYVLKRRSDGIFMEKLRLAAIVTAAFENPQDIIAQLGPVCLWPWKSLPGQAAPPGARFRWPRAEIVAWLQHCLAGSKPNISLLQSQSARPYCQRAVPKFAQNTGGHAIAGRHHRRRRWGHPTWH
ncbi:hypothetical protein ACP70R_048986 [Stipagrostis hirtigluma subsp. patula]